MIWRLTIAVSLSAIALVLWAIMTPGNHTGTPPLEQAREARVVHVIDGDTFELESGVQVRLIGIDAPELSSNGVQDAECFAHEAHNRARAVLNDRNVLLVRDISDTDTYDRLLRYVYMRDPYSSVHEGTSINELLVREGAARARAFPPDTKLQATLRRAERDAQEHARGMWGMCNS